MIEKIEVLGHEEDIMIIFASDHGDMLGKHGLNLKMCFYDAAIKVPLLFIPLVNGIRENAMIDW